MFISYSHDSLEHKAWVSLLRFGGQVDYANRFASKSLSSNSMELTFRSVECRRLGL